MIFISMPVQLGVVPSRREGQEQTQNNANKFCLIRFIIISIQEGINREYSVFTEGRNDVNIQEAVAAENLVFEGHCSGCNIEWLMVDGF